MEHHTDDEPQPSTSNAIEPQNFILDLTPERPPPPRLLTAARLHPCISNQRFADPPKLTARVQPWIRITLYQLEATTIDDEEYRLTTTKVNFLGTRRELRQAQIRLTRQALQLLKQVVENERPREVTTPQDRVRHRLYIKGKIDDILKEAVKPLVSGSISVKQFWDLFHRIAGRSQRPLSVPFICDCATNILRNTYANPYPLTQTIHDKTFIRTLSQ